MTDQERDEILECVNYRNCWSAIYENRDEIPEEFISEFIEFLDMHQVFRQQRLSDKFLEEHKGFLGDLYKKYKAIYTLADLDSRGDESVMLDFIQYFAHHDNDRSRLYRYATQDANKINQIFINREATDIQYYFKEQYGNNISISVFERAAKFNLDIYSMFLNGIGEVMTREKLIFEVEHLRKKNRMYSVSMFTSEFDSMLGNEDMAYVNLDIEPVEGVGEYPLGISMVINFDISPICLKDN